jgi:hypothetical protein
MHARREVLRDLSGDLREGLFHGVMRSGFGMRYVGVRFYPGSSVSFGTGRFGAGWRDGNACFWGTLATKALLPAATSPKAQKRNSSIASC